MDIEYLYKMFELINSEFYKNEENRWKFFQVFGAVLSGMVVAAYKVKDLELPLLILSSVISLAGILVLVSVYRIIVAIDQIHTKLQREVIKYIFDNGQKGIDQFFYPESTQFLHGSAYFFSMHNATTLILIGFFAFSTCRLTYLYLSENILFVGSLAIIESVLLFIITFVFSNMDYEKTPVKDE